MLTKQTITKTKWMYSLKAMFSHKKIIGYMIFLSLEQCYIRTTIENVPSKIRTVLGSMKQIFNFEKPLKNSCWQIFRSPATTKRKQVPLA